MTRETSATSEKQDQLEEGERKVKGEKQVPLGLKVVKERKETKVSLDVKEPKVYKETVESKVCVDPLDRQDHQEALVEVDPRVTQEIQELLVPMDHPDQLVCLAAMDETERRDIQDQGDLPETLDHLGTVKVVPFRPRIRNTLAYHLNRQLTMVPLRIPPLHVGTFLSSLAPRS